MLGTSTVKDSLVKACTIEYKYRHILRTSELQSLFTSKDSSINLQIFYSSSPLRDADKERGFSRRTVAPTSHGDRPRNQIKESVQVEDSAEFGESSLG